MKITTEIMVSIVLGVVGFIGTFIAYYFKVKSDIEKSIAEAIDDAEIPGKVGEEKLEIATLQLYDLVPTIFKPFLTKERLKKLVNKMFGYVEDYARKQVAKNK